ncbi:MAG: ATP-binding protein [Caulobacter sp.]|nr:ATP-binding protein [Caulobacter sp.]
MQILVFHRRRTVPQLENIRYPYISLFQDNWDDFGWRCRFVATLHRSEEEEVDLGPLRIAANNDQFRVDDPPALLEELPPRSASLGESVAYYRALRALPAGLRRRYLNTMRDIVARPVRRERIRDQNLWNKCFMRESSSRHALDRGGYYIGAHFEQAEPPNFSFEMRLPGASGPHQLNLDFSQHNDLPNRTILLIGRNGTGKTRTLAGLAAGLMPAKVFSDGSIEKMPRASVEPEITLSRLIAVSYNAFDEFPLPRPAGEKAPRIGGVAYKSRGSYKYCGLRNADGAITTNEIGQMLNQALEPVVGSDRVVALHDALSTLLNPDIASALTDLDDEVREEAVQSLSAGQRLIVSIFSNIVGFIEEKSLLLIDEPETNLHPGLLSTFVAALNETLVEFDSYAIVASHSPILLQQVPARYVRHFTRNSVDRPRVRALDFESFGEDLGELSRRALGLADPERDYTNVLDRLFEIHGSAEAVAGLFDYPLGAPAMAHLYGLEVDQEDDL